MRRTVVLVLALLLLGATAQGEKNTSSSYAREIDEWRAKRLKRLTADTGYLALAGLFWLDEGENSFGTDPKSKFVLREGSAPAHAGVFVHRNGVTTLRAAPDAEMSVDGKRVTEMTLRYSGEDGPDVVELGDLSFYVVKRGERFGVRLRDLQSPVRKSFRGIEAYPTDEAYRVVARFEPYDPPKKVPIASVIGNVDTLLAPGAQVFELHGKEYRLDPIVDNLDDEDFFLIFRDATSGEETYGAGRFLYTDLPRNGQVVVDFNKAYNPPCAFSPFTTCPLPPLQNYLDVAVRAGEKKYTKH